MTKANRKTKASSKRVPAANPKIDKKAGAKDMYANPAANVGFGTTSLVNGGRHVPFRISLDYQKLVFMYRGSWIIRKVVDTKPQDQLKAFPTITGKLTPEEISDFDKVIASTCTLQKYIEGRKWGRLFGGALGIIILAGEDQKNLAKPLKLEDVQPDSYRGMIVVDRWSGMSPSSQLITDIDNPAEYGLPIYYDVYTEASQTFRVHHSRCLRFVGRDLPLFEKQIETYWGMSEIECILDELNRYDYGMAGVADLISRANVLVMKEPMLAQMLSGVSMTQQQLQDYLARMAAVSEAITTNGILALGEDSELFSHAYSFSGLSDVGKMQMTCLCGAAGYPMSRMFGDTQTGLGSSNEGDLQTYYDEADQERKQRDRPLMDKLIPIICMSTFGQIPKDLNYTFPLMRSMNSKDKALLAKDQATAITAYANAGAFGQKTMLAEIKKTSADTDIGTTITNDMIAAATDEITLPDMAGGDEDEGDDSQANAGAKDSAFSRVWKRLRGIKDADPRISSPEAMKIYHGLDIVIETPAGGIRTGRGWENTLPADYGYIRGVEGADGDELDCYVGLTPESDQIFIVNQRKLGELEFDEHKVMLGYPSAEAAIADYMAGHHRSSEVFLSMRPMKITEFRKWMHDGDLTVPCEG